MKRLLSFRGLFLLTALSAAGLAVVYSIPKSFEIPLFDGNETLVFYRGLGFHGGPGYLGTNPYRVHVVDGEFGGKFDVRYTGGKEDYHSYRGHYDSGTLREEGRCYVLTFGEWISPDRLDIQSGKFYDVNGNLASSVTDGSGVQKLFWENGGLALEQNFAESEVTYRRRWHENGQLREDTLYLNGRPHGMHSMYFANGQLSRGGRYDAGRETGLWRYYNEDGSSNGAVDYDEP